MSRVIKGAIYNDEPKFVAVPTMVVSANEEGAQAEEELMTPEAQEHMLAEIRHKEAKASQLLRMPRFRQRLFVRRPRQRQIS